MAILCCLIIAFVVALVFLALLWRCKSYGADSDAKEPASVEAGGVITGGVSHANHNVIRRYRSSEVKVRCHTCAECRSSAMSFRDFALREMQFALRNAHVRLLRIDEPQVEAFEQLDLSL